MAINPLGQVAGQFYLDNHEIACIMGPVGSGKTTAACQRIARHVYSQRPYNGVAYSRWAIVRETKPQLRETTIKTWLKLFPESQYGVFETTNMVQRWRFKPRGLDYEIDAEFIFRALDGPDDVANLLSLEVTGFYFNELREIDPDVLPHALARCRYPGADLGGATWRGWIGDTNPWPFTSKYHELFVTAKPPEYEFFRQPGGLDPGAENLHNLEQTPETLALPWNHPVRRAQGLNYYKRLLRDYKVEEAKMYVHSKYGASRAGKPVFESYDDNVHCAEFEWDKRAPLFIGYDCTGRSPAAVVAQKTNTGQWLIGLELCEDNMGMKQHAAELKRLIADECPGMAVERITCDPAGKAKDANDLDMPQIIRNAFLGTTVVNARTNDPATRIEAVDGPLRRMINGGPAIVIHPRCKNLRQACISEYHYRRLKTPGKERFAEEPEKNHPFSDVADALEYLMLGGGEGRAQTGLPGSRDWGSNNAPAITPTPKIWTPFGI